MDSDKPINLVLCWHMHQPDYRDHLLGEYRFPWVYLHALKDYADMAAHLEALPQARAVVNFSPVLLQQIEDYRRMLDDCLKAGTPPRDPLLAALEAPVFPPDADHRITLVKACLRANQKHMIDPYPAYRRLARIADLVIEDNRTGTYINNQFLADIITWYHLVWLSEDVIRTDTLVQDLMEQGSGFSLHQRRQLLELIARELAALGERYRRLTGDGRVELSVSPFGHPILPLLLDFGAARESQPELPLPGQEHYPGGEERARWHIEHGLRVFERFFGCRPAGCWPPEGAVSGAALKLLADAGFRWAATGEAVLRNSIEASGGHDGNADPLYTAWTPPGTGLRLYGRNDGLSDLIGFSYADWDAEHAVEDLIGKVLAVGDDYAGEDTPTISIIMDGENAWEYFPHNGWYFLQALYTRLGTHPRIRLTTYTALQEGTPARPLQRVVAGSWVHGTLATWIGSEDKNRGWDILVEAKRCYDECLAASPPDEGRRETLEMQLAACEGSDWFWWFGDYNPASTVSDFEHLYRVHLANLYRMLGREPPQYLSQVLSHGKGSPERGGVMRTGAPGS
jgi:alpha-amylase/alpha-mannosidase (GH57 family)